MFESYPRNQLTQMKDVNVMAFEYKTVMRADRFGKKRRQQESYWVDDQTTNSNGTAFAGFNPAVFICAGIFAAFIIGALIG